MKFKEYTEYNLDVNCNEIILVPIISMTKSAFLFFFVFRIEDHVTKSNRTIANEDNTQCAESCVGTTTVHTHRLNNIISKARWNLIVLHLVRSAGLLCPTCFQMFRLLFSEGMQ